MFSNDFFNAIPDVSLETDLIVRYRPSLAQSAAQLIGLWKPPVPKTGMNTNAQFSGTSFTGATGVSLDTNNMVPSVINNPPTTTQKTVIFDSTFVVPFGPQGPVLNDGAHSRFTYVMSLRTEKLKPAENEYSQNAITFTNRPWRPLLMDVINGTAFDADIANVVYEQIDGGDILFFNSFFAPHPLHVHASPFWVIGQGALPYDPR